MSKRILSLLLTLVLLLPLAACSAPETAEEETASAADPSEAADPGAAEETAPLPETEAKVPGPAPTDLGGYSFRILTSYWYDNNKIIFPEELTGEEGYLTLAVDEERLGKALDAFARLMENGINKDSDGQWGYGTKYFAQGQALFNYPQILDIPAQMHDTDIRFGTIPPPKLDETQKDYISGSFDVYWAIPKTAYKQLDTVATVIEAMGHNCYYDVLPGAYETTLQVRFSDSPNDARAYEIIRDSMCVDIGYAFNERCTGISSLVRAFSTMTSGNMSSTIASNRKTIEKQLEKVNNKYREMNAADYTAAP